MLELYEQNKPTQANEADGSAGDGQRPPSKALANEEHLTRHKPAPSRPSSDGHHIDNNSELPRTTQTRNSEYGSSENNSQVEDEIHEREVMPQHGNSENKAIAGHGDDNDHDRDAVESRDKIHGRNLPNKDNSTNQTPQESTKKLDREKLKAAFERRKARGDITRKIDPLDELERELEDVEVPSDNDKSKRERKQIIKSSHEDDIDTVEEGEVKLSDEVDQEHRSPNKSTRKRKAGSPLERNGLGRHNYSERDHKRHVQENHV